MTVPTSKAPWNKGKLVGQKLPLKLEQIWAVRYSSRDSEEHPRAGDV